MWFFPVLLNRRVWIALGTVMLIVGGVVAFRIWRADLIGDAKTEVRTEYELRDERRAREDAEADRAFLIDQAAKRDAEAAAWRQTLARLSSRVETSRETVIERIRSGELPVGQISPVRLATMAEIERLEAQRQAEETP